MEQYANAAVTTLSGNGGSITNVATSLIVASSTGFPSSGNFRIIIGSELLLVTAVSGTTWTVTRGVESTSAASHSDGATVTHILTAASLRAVINTDGSTLESSANVLRVKDSGITLAKIANIADARILGNNTGGSAAPVELTAVQVKTLLVVAGYNDAGNSSTALTIDWSADHTQKVTLTGNCTFTFSNPTAGDVYVLHLVQDGTGSRTVTWPGSVKWAAATAPTLTTSASKRDIVTFSYDGTNYFGVTSGQNYS